MGGEVATNVSISEAVLAGKRGPARDAVVLNAGAGIYASGAAESIGEGVRRAEAAIDAGLARERLRRLVVLTRELAAAAAEVKPA
jgi:anthranilate phosphoribosyltransferase